jgi:hypothetical protein
MLIRTSVMFWRISLFHSEIPFFMPTTTIDTSHLTQCRSKYDSIAINNQLQQQGVNSAVANGESAIQDVCRIAELWSVPFTKGKWEAGD